MSDALMLKSILVFLILNFVATTFLLMHNLSLKRTLASFRVDYITDVSDVSGVFKKTKKMIVKTQVYLGDIPIGGPVTISETIHETVSTENVSALLDALSAPILRIGIRNIKRFITGI